MISASDLNVVKHWQNHLCGNL